MLNFSNGKGNLYAVLWHRYYDETQIILSRQSALTHPYGKNEKLENGNLGLRA